VCRYSGLNESVGPCRAESTFLGLASGSVNALIGPFRRGLQSSSLPLAPHRFFFRCFSNASAVAVDMSVLFPHSPDELAATYPALRVLIGSLFSIFCEGLTSETSMRDGAFGREVVLVRCPSWHVAPPAGFLAHFDQCLVLPVFLSKSDAISPPPSSPFLR